LERRGVLHHAARITGRQRNVLDDDIARIERSSSPKAWPDRVSYWPAAPKLAPSKAGEILVVNDDAGDARVGAR